MTDASYLIHPMLQLFIILMLEKFNIAMPIYSPYLFILSIPLVLCLFQNIFLRFEKTMQDFIHLRNSALQKS
jgi:hypothetical protein